MGMGMVEMSFDYFSQDVELGAPCPPTFTRYFQGNGYPEANIQPLSHPAPSISTTRSAGRVKQGGPVHENTCFLALREPRKRHRSPDATKRAHHRRLCALPSLPVSGGGRAAPLEICYVTSASVATSSNPGPPRLLALHPHCKKGARNSGQPSFLRWLEKQGVQLRFFCVSPLCSWAPHTAGGRKRESIPGRCWGRALVGAWKPFLDS